MPVVPYLADSMGRKWAAFTGTAFIFAGVVIQSVGANIGMFITVRFVIGLGNC